MKISSQDFIKIKEMRQFSNMPDNRGGNDALVTIAYIGGSSFYVWFSDYPRGVSMTLSGAPNVVSYRYNHIKFDLDDIIANFGNNKFIMSWIKSLVKVPKGVTKSMSESRSRISKYF